MALFVNLKAAFNTVDRRILVREMRRRGVRKRLVQRVKK